MVPTVPKHSPTFELTEILKLKAYLSLFLLSIPHVHHSTTSYKSCRRQAWSEETKQWSEPRLDMSQILELLDGKKFKITMINILKVSMENVNNKKAE